MLNAVAGWVTERERLYVDARLGAQQSAPPRRGQACLGSIQAHSQVGHRFSQHGSLSLGHCRCALCLGNGHLRISLRLSNSRITAGLCPGKLFSQPGNVPL